MKTRSMGRLGWDVSEVGYGMWGIGGGKGGWTGSDDEESLAALNESVSLGCSFFDTAWIYGRGHSERLLGELLRQHPDRKLHVATKIPPKDWHWPSTRDSRIEDVFPPDHIREYTERSLENLRVDCIDLLQFHVWEDAWADDTRWQDTVADLKRQGVIKAVGISINRWEPWNAIQTLHTSLIDAVQVCYSIFDQSPADELIPLCQQLQIGVIARVPFDEGSLTGNLTRFSRWPKGDWRNSYFVPENLIPTVERIDHLKQLVPAAMNLPSMALRFVLHNEGICTVIPGMRRIRHVRENMAVSDCPALAPKLINVLKRHRWDRQPTSWSQ